MDFDFDKIGDFFKNDGGEVSYWKVLGGAAGAVVGVMALPIAGGVGAITAAGAAVATAVGGLTGAAVSYYGSSESDEKDKARKAGFADGKAEASAEHLAQVKKLQAALAAALQRIKEREQFFELVVALHAVGVACAACDGQISENEARDIREFVTGVGFQSMPPHIQQKVEAITAAPPSIETAFELAKNCGVEAWELFDEVISLVSFADGAPNSQEAQFRAEWVNLRQAA
jgi:hypothetical protein